MKQKKSREKSEIFRYTVTNCKYYFPFYKNKFCFSARSLFFPYSQELEEPREMGFGGVLLKQHIGENARKLVKTGAKNTLDFFAHEHI